MLKDSKNLTVVLLAISAVVLGAMVVGTWSDSAWAGEPAGTSYGSDYVMVSGAWTGSTDILYIVDVRAQRLNAYFIDRQDEQVQLRDSIDLARLFNRN
ncbi:MAG: hypothetical protein ACOC93_02240 [Planctomycetota bacterium]